MPPQKNRQRTNIQQRPNVRRGQERRDFSYGDSGGDEIVSHGYYPSTNDSLRRTVESLPDVYAGKIGMTADEIGFSPKKVSVSIARFGEVMRETDRVPAADLSTGQEIAAQGITISRDAQDIKISGQLPVQVMTSLILGERAIAFRQAELGSVRGASGPVGLLGHMPGQEISSEISKEYFMIAKKGQNEVILAVGSKEPEQRQTRRVIQAKERVVQSLRGKLQELMSAKGSSKEQLKEVTDQIAYIQKQRPIVFIKEEPLPDEIESRMKSIETVIDGDKETLKGYVHFDESSKAVTIARPVKIEPSLYGIRSETIKLYDATGKDRDIRFVDGSERDLAPMMQTMLRNLHRPEPVQKEDGGLREIVAAETRLYRDPYAVLPSFIRQ